MAIKDMSKIVSALNEQSKPEATVAPQGSVDVAGIKSIASDNDANATVSKNAADINQLAIAIVLMSTTIDGILEEMIRIQDMVMKGKEVEAPESPETEAPEAPVVPEVK